MTHEEIVEILYRGILGREPDAAGLDHHRYLLDQGESIEAIVAAMKASPEARRNRQRNTPFNVEGAEEFLTSQLKRKLAILDIGAQTLDYEKHVYEPLVTRGVVEAIIGFEPIAEKARLRNEEEAFVNIHPIALGTGASETLYINNFDATSSLLPINTALMGTTHGLHEYETIREEKIQTTRLDDVDTPKHIDFLKLDIQGYEFKVLENSISTLKKSLFVQCEVEFKEIYKGQHLFGDILNFFIRNDFEFIDILNQVRLSSKDFVQETNFQASGKLFWGDAVFIRKTIDHPEDFISQAVVAGCVYGWLDICFDLLREYDGLVGTDLSAQYMSRLLAENATRRN